MKQWLQWNRNIVLHQENKEAHKWQLKNNFLKINYFPEFWRINFTTESLLSVGGLPFWEMIFIQGLETQVLQKVRIITKTNDLNDVTWMKVYFFFIGKWTRYTPCFTKVNLIRTLAACTTEKSFFNTF